MKAYVLAGLLLTGLSGCAKKEDIAPTATPATPAAPVIIQAFAPSSGALALTSRPSPPDTLRGLTLQIASQDNGDQTVTFSYTWRGHTSAGFSSVRGYMPAGTGIEVTAKFTTKKAVPLGNGPWSVGVSTNTTDPDFKNPLGLDYAGQGLLTLTPAGYTLPFTAQFISGSLTQ